MYCGYHNLSRKIVLFLKRSCWENDLNPNIEHFTVVTFLLTIALVCTFQSCNIQEREKLLTVISTLHFPWPSVLVYSWTEAIQPRIDCYITNIHSYFVKSWLFFVCAMHAAYLCMCCCFCRYHQFRSYTLKSLFISLV